jgi:hypothetical protein
MHPTDRALPPGSGWGIVLGLASLLLIIVYAFVEPEQRFASYFVVIVCGGGTGRQYVRMQDQDGVELLGTVPGGFV